MLSIGSKIGAMTVIVLGATMGEAATAQMPPSPAQEHAQEKATVGVSILPGIIGPGNGVQGSGSAKWAVIGKYDSSKEGKKVVLQRRSGSGWVTADKGKLDKKGRIVFAVPGASSGSPVSYRVDGPAPRAPPSAPTTGGPTRTSATSSRGPSSTSPSGSTANSPTSPRPSARAPRATPRPSRSAPAPLS